MSNAANRHHTMEQRLGRLERSLRRWRAGGVCALLVALAGMALGQAQTDKIITANKFVLVSADGQERGVLSLDDAGEPYLELTSPRHPQRNIIIATETDGAGITVNWETGYRAALGVTPTFAAIGVGAAPDTPQAVLIITAQDGPAVTIHDNVGQIRWRTPQIDN